MRLSSTPREAKSTTRSSKSGTNSAGLDTPVQFVKGVGPKLGAIFASRGIETVRDLLTFFPRAYEDRSQVTRISELVDGVSASVSVKVISARRIQIRSRFKSLVEVKC